MLNSQFKGRQDEPGDPPSGSLLELLRSEGKPFRIPVVLCGKTEKIGSGVIAALKPEFEVVHFITTPASGAEIIPALLAGREPPTHPDSSSIGSGEYAETPRAVILGAAFDEEATQTLRKAVSEAPDARKVPWLRHDAGKPAPPIGPEYGLAVVARVREVLERLEGEGKLDGTYGEDVWY
ncbi:hypothetical protein CSOJ01_03767 [Colletotrichum sojae]|uniref:Uncharacterized protein n=1 Tax=Colletotrichum sojae TaxID=2175907 RepID=A0A8H6MZN9_9PEZI|nr:hypothetical protein CSOJ01_03767 [Colletotrichum sojae]